MNDPKPGTARVVKMDGDWTEFPEHPETHPACSEILEFPVDGTEPPKVIYRRP